MILAHYRPPFFDELMYSWLKDLADTNFPMDPRGLQRAVDILFPWSKTPRMRGRITHEEVRPDFLKGFDKSLRSLKEDGYTVPDTEQFITFNTILIASGISRKECEQARRIHNVATEATGDLLDPAPLPVMIREFKYCPECMKEERYFRTWHNLPDVNACAKHGLKLLTFDPVKRRLSHEHVEASEDDIAYAEYSLDIYKNPSGINLEDIRRYLLDHDYAAVNEVKRFTNLRIPFKEVVLTLISYDVSYPDIVKSVAEKSLFQERKCEVCGNVWTDHKKVSEYGFGCPECMKKADPEDVISSILSRIGDGKYELAEPFKGIGKSPFMTHKTCGETVPTSLTRRIWERSVCPCEGRHTIQSVQKMIDDIAPGYTVEKYIPHGMKVDLRHDRCGHVRRILYTNFKRDHSCPACNKKAEEHKRIKELEDTLGPEYEVLAVGYRNDLSTLKHKPCGTVYKGKWYTVVIRGGRRCPLCEQRIKDKRDGEEKYILSLYKEMCEWFRDHDEWIPKEHRTEEHTSQYYDSLRELVRRGYIERPNTGVYIKKGQKQ